MKKIVACIALSLAAFGASAGDAAVFSDIGFSEDGKTYIFGQYGKTDQTYEAWAEIYTVDIASNDFVKGEVYRTPPSEGTASLSGKKAYEDLVERTRWKTSRYQCTPSTARGLLYVRNNERKKGTDEIMFKDFEADPQDCSTYYRVRLVPTFEGEGKDVQSRFYISLQKVDLEGNVLYSREVGTPDFRRKGVTDYCIERIFTDQSGQSLIFIVEKTLLDDSGVSIRYMVEAMRF